MMGISVQYTTGLDVREICADLAASIERCKEKKVIFSIVSKLAERWTDKKVTRRMCTQLQTALDEYAKLTGEQYQAVYTTTVGHGIKIKYLHQHKNFVGYFNILLAHNSDPYVREREITERLAVYSCARMDKEIADYTEAITKVPALVTRWNAALAELRTCLADAGIARYMFDVK